MTTIITDGPILFFISVEGNEGASERCFSISKNLFSFSLTSKHVASFLPLLPSQKASGANNLPTYCFCGWKKKRGGADGVSPTVGRQVTLLLPPWGWQSSLLNCLGLGTHLWGDGPCTPPAWKDTWPARGSVGMSSSPSSPPQMAAFHVAVSWCVKVTLNAFSLFKKYHLHGLYKTTLLRAGILTCQWELLLVGVSGSQYPPKSFQRTALTLRKRFQVASWCCCPRIAAFAGPPRASTTTCHWKNRRTSITLCVCWPGSLRYWTVGEKRTQINNLIVNTLPCKHNTSQAHQYGSFRLCSEEPLFIILPFINYTHMHN